MKKLITVLCYFYICYVMAASVQKKIKNLEEREYPVIPGDNLITTDNLEKYLKQEKQGIHMNNKNKSSLEDSDVKINESDLYENGQEAKENSERSFVIINQKFKSQRIKARPVQQKNFFDDNNKSPDFDTFALKKNKINAEDIIQPTHKNEISDHVTQFYNIYKLGNSYFHQVPEELSPGHNEGEYVELLKRTIARPIVIASNDRNKVSRPVNEFFISHDVSLDTNSLFQIMDSGSVGEQKNTLVDDDINSIPFETMDDDAKFNQHLKSALRDVTSNEKDENKYNCYNSKCKAVLDIYNNIINNGVKVGLRCLCVEAVLRDRTGVNWNVLSNVTPTEEYSTELTESEEAMVKETSKLMKMGEENESSK